MTYTAILVASAILLLTFGIERLGRATGIPAVIMLIAIGLAGKPLLGTFGLTLVGIDRIVPVLGAIGLVLIVLEGALDIELKRSRLKAAASAFAMAASGFLVIAGVLAGLAMLALSLDLVHALLLAVPCAVISSAVAIPSSSFLPKRAREFVVYESSLSDILGVLVFFAVLNSDGSLKGMLLGLIGGGVLSLLLALVFAVGMVLVLMRLDGHIRFIPLLAGLFGLYAAGELLKLSPLILVLLFGLALNNPTLITRFHPLRDWMDDTYEATLSDFKLLVMELTFAVRGFFFILLGYWTELAGLASARAWLAAAIVLVVVFGSRHVMLRLGRVPMGNTLAWIAPRGLITILLFISARESLSMPVFADGAVMLVVLASAALISFARRKSSAATPQPQP
ncbi:MAG: hypothetical protein R3E35_15025 [Rhodocyclaceae bacterium]